MGKVFLRAAGSRIQEHDALRGGSAKWLSLRLEQFGRPSMSFNRTPPSQRVWAFPSSTIDALSKGRPDEALRPEERTAQRFTLKLTKQHSVDSETFEEARAVFKDRGIVEIVILAGCYDLVSSLLNAFEIPVPEQAGAGPRVVGEHNTQDDVTSSSGGAWTSHNQAPQAQLTTVAEFPPKLFSGKHRGQG